MDWLWSLITSLLQGIADMLAGVWAAVLGLVQSFFAFLFWLVIEVALLFVSIFPIADPAGLSLWFEYAGAVVVWLLSYLQFFNYFIDVPALVGLAGLMLGIEALLNVPRLWRWILTLIPAAG